MCYNYVKCWQRLLEEAGGVCCSCTGDGEQGTRWVGKEMTAVTVPGLELKEGQAFI